MEFDSHKSGLANVDKDKITEVIRNLSKGSAFYENEQRKRQERERKVEQLKQKEVGFFKIKDAYERLYVSTAEVEKKESDDVVCVECSAETGSHSSSKSPHATHNGTTLPPRLMLSSLAGEAQKYTKLARETDALELQYEIERAALSDPHFFAPQQRPHRLQPTVEMVSALSDRGPQTEDTTQGAQSKKWDDQARGWIRVFAHVDMDMFYAACEEKRLRHLLAELIERRRTGSSGGATLGDNRRTVPTPPPPPSENTDSDSSSTGIRPPAPQVSALVDKLYNLWEQQRRTQSNGASLQDNGEGLPPSYQVPLPLAVGSSAMLSTTNYVARQYGVRSAMPGFIGQKLCPELAIVPVDFALYRRESAVVQSHVQETLLDPLAFTETEEDDDETSESGASRTDATTVATPRVHAAPQPSAHRSADDVRSRYFMSFGLDEFTIELTEVVYRRLRARRRAERQRSTRVTSSDKDALKTTYTGGATDELPPTVAEQFEVAASIVAEMRASVLQLTELSCSGGIAPTPLLAKIVSNYKKPNGQYVLAIPNTKSAVQAFLFPQPLREMPGIGKSTEQILNGLGIHTLGDIYRERVRLRYLFPTQTFSHLLSSATGASYGFYGGFGESPSAKDGAEQSGHGRTDGNDSNSNSGVGVAESEGSTRKSIGQERTFSTLQSRLELQEIALHNLRRSLSRLVEKKLYCGRVGLKVKLRTFRVRNYSKTVSSFVQGQTAGTGTGEAATLCGYTQSEEVLRGVLDALMLPLLSAFRDYRLLGVRLEDLITEEEARRRVASQANSRSGGGGGGGPLDRLFLSSSAAAQGRRAVGTDGDVGSHDEYSNHFCRVHEGSAGDGKSLHDWGRKRSRVTAEGPVTTDYVDITSSTSGPVADDNTSGSSVVEILSSSSSTESSLRVGRVAVEEHDDEDSACIVIDD